MPFLPWESAGRRQAASGWTRSSLRCALLPAPHLVMSTRPAALMLARSRGRSIAMASICLSRAGHPTPQHTCCPRAPSAR